MVKVRVRVGIVGRRGHEAEEGKKTGQDKTG